MAGFFATVYIRKMERDMDEVNKRNHELTYEISHIRENYTSKEDLSKMFALYMDPIHTKLSEIQQDLKNKQDKA